MCRMRFSDGLGRQSVLYHGAGQGHTAASGLRSTGKWFLFRPYPVNHLPWSIGGENNAVHCRRTEQGRNHKKQETRHPEGGGTD